MGRIAVEISDADEKKFRDLAEKECYTLKVLFIKMLNLYQEKASGNSSNNK